MQGELVKPETKRNHMRKKKTTVAAAAPQNLPEGRVDNAYPVANLKHAPWNPRTPEELKPDHPEMVKLVESVRALGVVQPIAVWDTGTEYLCIAGNRRLEAVKIVGLKSVPAILYVDIDEVTARAITRAENEVRFGVSPLLDAKLIGDLKDQGRSQAEIAAVFGVSEAKICRRAKLLQLSPETVEFFAQKPHETAALEFLADKSLGDAKRQKDILSKIHVYSGEEIKLSTVRYAFNQTSMILDFDSWVFKCPGGEELKRRCATCGLCTGNQPDLFGETEGGSENRCLDPKCFKRVESAAKREKLVAAIVASGGSEDDVRRCKEVNYFAYDVEKKSKKKRSKSRPFPYARWESYDHDYKVIWAPDPKEEAKAEKERKASEDAKLAERRKQEETADAAVERVVKWFLTPVEGEYDNGNYSAQILRRLESLKGVGGEELCLAAFQNMLSKALALGDIESEYGSSELRRELVNWLNTHQCLPADVDLTDEEIYAISSMED